MNKSSKALIVYASRSTGNTKKLAEAIHKSFGENCDIATAADAPSPDKYDFIMLGFGIYRGWPDGDMRAYMKKCQKKDVGIFLTLGAYPNSEHAFNCMGRAEGSLSTCRVKAKFICHGRLDPAMIERMKARPAGAPHSWDEERAQRVMEAETHPDENDITEASRIFKTAWDKILSGPMKRKEKEEKFGILLAAFGTTVESGKKAYENIESIIKENNPSVPVRWAYTSDMVRKKLRKKGVAIQSVRGALNEMVLEDFTSVKIISLHVVPGEEHHKLIQEASVFNDWPLGFKNLEITKPLLSNAEQLEKLCDAIFKDLPQERNPEDAVVLMGHGNEKGICELNYIAAAHEFKKHDKNVFLACVEGRPRFEKIRKELSEKKVKKAFLMPFMIVAGDHAQNDLAGDEEDSWKSMLESDGIECVPILQGISPGTILFPCS
jgi:sirohydrochlorin cobaltochelatase